MIYARRALQRRLNELRPILGNEATGALAVRLNRQGRDRVAAMWEVAVLHGLSALGEIGNEVPLASGRRPDIAFASDAIAFVADITSVSDDGLKAQNPFSELSQEIEAAKTRLGLAIGGLDLRVDSRDEVGKRGRRRVLILPDRKHVREFVRTRIEPELRKQMRAGQTVLSFSIKSEDVSFSLTIDPARGHYNSGGHAAYDTPTIRDQNPLYNALKLKADKLRDAEGIRGIIVGDAGSRSLADRGFSPDGLSAEAIIQELFRQYSSIEFVLLLSVRDEREGWFPGKQPTWQNHALLRVREASSVVSELNTLFRAMMERMPEPAMAPLNGALRASEPGYDLGHHGGYGSMGLKVRIGARELVEILAGQRSIEDDGAKFLRKRVKPRERRNPVEIAFGRALSEGRLPSSIVVTKTGEDESDDWIEFEFGEPDPAISPLG